MTAATIAAGKKLSLIVRAGAGVNTIDVEAANQRGIYVTNCPGKNSAAVAELAIGLLIACDRRIVSATNDLRGGQWRKKEYGKARGLRGRTLGIIGVGMIGKEVIGRAHGLGMQVVAWSRSLTEATAAELGVTYCASPLEVARCSDAVSIHVAAAPETNNMVGREFLDAMKNDAILINAARGEVVDRDALLDAIQRKGLRVGLDVFADEPKPGEAPFADTQLAQLVTATPHIGASTDEASEAIADEVVRIVRLFRETGKPVNTVNMCAGRRPLIRSSSGTTIASASWPAFSTCCVRKASTSKRWRTRSSPVRRPPAVRCSSIRRRPPRVLATLGRTDAILQVSLESR